MIKNKKILTAGLSALLIASVFASPASNNTSGIFRNDADKYMDTLNFSEVEFDNLFGTINISETEGLSAGTAFNIGGIYFGTEYFGNLFSITNTKTTTVKTTQKEGTGVNAGTVGSTEKVTTVEKTGTYTNNDSSYWKRRDIFTVLTGIGDIGIKTQFFTIGNASTSSSTPSLEETNDINAPTVMRYTKAKTSSNQYQTTVEAGLPLSLGDEELGLKSGLTFSVNNNKEKAVIQYYNWYNNEKGDLYSDYSNMKNEGNFMINPYFSAYAFDAGLEYSFSYNLFANGIKTPTKTKLKAKTYSENIKENISSTDADGSVSKSLNQTAKYKTAKSETSNRVVLNYGKTKDLNEKFTVGFKANTELRLETIKSGNNNNYSYSCTEYNYDNATAEKKSSVNVAKVVSESVSVNDRVTNTTVFGISPSVALAAQYKMIPSKVTLNAGFKVSPDANSFAGTHNWNYKNAFFVYDSTKVTGNGTNVTTTKTETTYTDGTVINEKATSNVTTRTTEETKNTTDYFYNVATSLSCGATFNMTENLDFDCTLNAVSKYGISSILSLFNMNMTATFRF